MIPTRFAIAAAAAACLFGHESLAGPPAESIVPTRTMEPREYLVTLEDLPEPFATDSARKPPRVVDVPEDAVLEVPAGFVVNRYARVERARWLALTPDGDLLCCASDRERIHLLRDEDGDGVAESSTIFASKGENGLDLPFGMAFADGHFYVGNTGEVRRYPFEPGQRRIEGRGRRVTDLPGQGYRQHWTRNVIVAPGGERLFVSVGSRSNVSVEEPPRASILRMRLDGSDRELYATGLRNPVGMDVHPETGELYTTVNERDALGDNLVPDYLTRVRQGAFYGWPYAYLSPELLDPRRMEGGRSEAPELAARTVMPDVLFESHSAALGLVFYDGAQFPERYRGGAFVVFRGSWNRDRGTGYKVVFVPFGPDGRPTGGYEDFVTGFMIDPEGPVTWGRPVGAAVLPDGSLVFTEEANGFVYRVSYQGVE